MITIFTSTDPSEIAFAKALFSGLDIPFHLADVHTSIIEGSIGILPQRLMVLEEDAEAAIEALRDNELIK